MRIVSIARERGEDGLRVAAYVRVSTAQEDQEDSLENQTRHYSALIQAHPDYSFAGVYADQKSGTDAGHREGFMRMMNDALDRRIDRVLVKSVSRFSRNTLDTYHYLQVLNSHGVSVYFEKERTEIANAYTSIAFSLSAAAAQQEALSISENVKRANRKRYGAGLYSAKPYECLGYTAVDGRLTPDHNADAVRAIYRLFLEGYTYAEISRRLTARGVVNARGNSVSPKQVKWILTNATYTGDIILLKTPGKELFTKAALPSEAMTIEADHTPIIDRSTWHRAQARLEALSEERRKTVKSQG